MRKDPGIVALAGEIGIPAGAGAPEESEADRRRGGGRIRTLCIWRASGRIGRDEKIHRDMRIVLTNDDGIHAPGLLAARQALEEIGDGITVAPDRNRSGVGRSITFGSTLHVEEREMADGTLGYACTGTPVDCVRLVALGLMDFEPDIVVSGINHGENLGDDITYSGTVAGAMEGIVIGVPGIAVSLSIDRPWHETVEEDAPLDGRLHFEPVADFTARLAKIAFKGLPQGRILNVKIGRAHV